MRSLLSIPATAFFVFIASIGFAHASPIDIGANFLFSTNAGMTASPCGTACTINDPGSAGYALLQSNFTVNGDFTVQVTQSGGRVGVEQENIGFEVGFAGGNLTNQFLKVNDGSQPIAPLWGGSLNYPSGPPTIFPAGNLTNFYSAQLELQRIGNTVNLFFGNTLVMSDTSTNYAGAATLYFVVSDAFDRSTPGFGAWDNLTIDTTATPLPGALPLFMSGLGALGLLGWRRKRKAAALAA